MRHSVRLDPDSQVCSILMVYTKALPSACSAEGDTSFASSCHASGSATSPVSEFTPLLSSASALETHIGARYTMETTKKTRAGRFLDKIAVESEPGLTTTQLMLANEDLKPVPISLRTWGFMNFVAFWISDSFNINTVGLHRTRLLRTDS